jgi:hypothetical protein
MAVILCPTMDEPLRSTLVDKFSLALPGHLKPTNSKDEAATTTNSETVHFDWYNRFSTDVCLFYFNFMLLLIFLIFRDLKHPQTFIPGLCKKHKSKKQQHILSSFLVLLKSSRIILRIIFNLFPFLKIYFSGNKVWYEYHDSF